MLITIKEEVTREIEIGEFPMYRKNVCYWVKIISRDLLVVVCNGMFPSIQINDNRNVADKWFLEDESNEEEFLSKYFELKNKISEMVEQYEMEYPLNLQKAI